MEAYLSQFIERIAAVDPCWAYVILFFSAILENVVPPVPGDTVVVFSAYLVGRGALAALPVYLATCLGGTAGFMVMYALGYARGRAFLEHRAGPLFGADNLARAECWLARHGLVLILANRFFGGIRTVVALSAGIGRMDWRRVALAAAISMALWNGVLLYTGILVGRNWSAVVAILRSYNQVVLLILAAGVVTLVVRRRRKKHT